MKEKTFGILCFQLRNFLKPKLLFWLCVIILSAWNMSSIFILMVKRFQTDSTSIGVTTTYIHWTNTFPSISICLSKNRIPKNFSDIVQQQTAENKSLPYTYIRTIYDYLFVKPNDFYIKAEYCKGLNSTCGVDIHNMRKKLLAQTCETFMDKIMYSKKTIVNCERIFKFHILDMGYCFLANNLIDYKSSDQLPLKYLPSDTNRQLELILKGGLIYRYDLYVHSPEDLPYINALSYTIPPDPFIYSFNIEEIHNNEDVLDENVHQRFCKFPTETEDEHSFYSFSTCMSQIRNEMELKYCNCTLFSQSNKGKFNYCGIQGISCLDEADILGKVKEFLGSNLVCLPSCKEQQISSVGSRENKVEKLNGMHYVKIEIATCPTARYYRTVTQSKLDFIVAAGGVIGLFIGASLINILEVGSVLLHTTKKMLCNK